MLAIGAASSPSSTGPFTDIGKPLVHDAQMGLIDASEFETNGQPYALWKEDGNAVGQKTPIHAQTLAPDGLSLVGSPATLITNDKAWEGNVVEGPWMLAHAGEYFLFYSGAAYNNATYAVGVAKSNSPLGPFLKSAGPILVTGGVWAGPGHCSVVDTPRGNTAMVYHAWKSTSIGGAPGRLVLVDTIDWAGGWPNIPLSPSNTSRPLP
jgi:GH43 family beta-xylosidase